MIGRFRFLAALAMIAMPALQSSQVPEFQVGNALGCTACHIEIERVVTLGAGDSKPICSPFAHVAASDNSYFVAPTCQPGEINVYSRAGELTGVLGGSGEGPGEFRAVRALWAPPAGIVHAAGMPRHVIFGADGKVLSEFPSPGIPHDLILFEDGTSVQHIVVRSPDRVGLPAHVVSREGQILRSFGAENPLFRLDRLEDAYRVMARADGDSVWLARLQPYVIQKWTVEGRRLLEMSRPANAMIQLTNGHEYAVQAVRQDPSGFLWVQVTVSSLADPASVPPPDVPSAADFNERGDTLIEVIDVAGRHVVARQLVEPYLHGWLGKEALTYGHRDTEAGDVVVDIWRVQLHLASTHPH